MADTEKIAAVPHSDIFTRGHRSRSDAVWTIAIKALVVLMPVASVVCIPWVRWQTEGAYASEAARMYHVPRLDKIISAQERLQTDIAKSLILIEQDAERHAIIDKGMESLREVVRRMDERQMQFERTFSKEFLRKDEVPSILQGTSIEDEEDLTAS